MKKRFVNKANHPMFGKHHTAKTRSLISKMRSKRPIGLFDLNNILLHEYPNQVVLAKFLRVNKTTISRYIKSGRVFQSKYFIKELH